MKWEWSGMEREAATVADPMRVEWEFRINK